MSSWRDVYSIAVKWRQVSEPCDSVVWVDKLRYELMLQIYLYSQFAFSALYQDINWNLTWYPFTSPSYFFLHWVCCDFEFLISSKVVLSATFIEVNAMTQHTFLIFWSFNYALMCAVRRSLQQDSDHTLLWCLDKLKLFAIIQILKGAAVQSFSFWSFVWTSIFPLLFWGLIGTVLSLHNLGL